MLVVNGKTSWGGANPQEVELERYFNYECIKIGGDIWVYLCLINHNEWIYHIHEWIGYDWVQVILFCVMCLWHAQILLCQCSKTFPDGENRASSHRQARKWRSNPVWNPEIGHARIAEPMCTPPSSLGKEMVFSYLFSLLLLLFDMPIFWKPFFAYHGVPMATKKRTTYNIAFMKDILKLHQPSTWCPDDPTTSLATLAPKRWEAG